MICFVAVEANLTHSLIEGNELLIYVKQSKFPSKVQMKFKLSEAPLEQDITEVPKEMMISCYSPRNIQKWKIRLSYLRNFSTYESISNFRFYQLLNNISARIDGQYLTPEM